MVDVAPGELGDVDQAVDAVEVDERAEVDDVRDDALDDAARLERVQDALPQLAALLLEHGTAREHDVVARAVELDDPSTQRLVAVLLEILHAADVDQRRGQEAAHAEVEDEPALDDLDDESLDGLAALGRLFDLAPGLLEARALLGEDETPVGVLLLHDERVDLVTQRDLLERIHVAADRQLGDRDDSLALVADIDQDLSRSTRTTVPVTTSPSPNSLSVAP